jgi:hypothetical protein
VCRQGLDDSILLCPGQMRVARQRRDLVGGGVAPLEAISAARRLECGLLADRPGVVDGCLDPGVRELRANSVAPR